MLEVLVVVAAAETAMASGGGGWHERWDVEAIASNSFDGDRIETWAEAVAFLIIVYQTNLIHLASGLGTALLL